jgi:hypothetical protein
LHYASSGPGAPRAGADSFRRSAKYVLDEKMVTVSTDAMQTWSTPLSIHRPLNAREEKR